MDTRQLDIAREVLPIARSIGQRDVHHIILPSSFYPPVELLTFVVRQYKLLRVVLGMIKQGCNPLFNPDWHKQDFN